MWIIIKCQMSCENRFGWTEERWQEGEVKVNSSKACLFPCWYFIHAQIIDHSTPFRHPDNPAAIMYPTYLIWELFLKLGSFSCMKNWKGLEEGGSERWRKGGVEGARKGEGVGWQKEKEGEKGIYCKRDKCQRKGKVEGWPCGRKRNSDGKKKGGSNRGSRAGWAG